MVARPDTLPGCLVLVCGDDEFAVKQRARQIQRDWQTEIGGMDHEIIDAAVGNSGEALRVLGKLREALQTLPFFGGAKTVWLQNCSFLGDDRTASSSAVTESLALLAQQFKEFKWGGVRLLISAEKVDKRKTFFKTLEKLGTVEILAGWSADDRDWADRAETWARQELKTRKKEIEEEALASLVEGVGPNARLLGSEVEKLSLYVGDRPKIQPADVAAVSVRNRQARAFALGDALGDRDLPRLLRCLEDEMSGMRTDAQRSEIGLLYGLISKVRALLLLKEMLHEGWVRPERDYNRFKAQLQKIPADQLPEDRRFNPLSINSYVLFKALPQCQNYSREELVRAMDRLLQCNRRLVSSSLDEALVLQQALVEIVRGAKPGVRGTATAP